VIKLGYKASRSSRAGQCWLLLSRQEVVSIRSSSATSFQPWKHVDGHAPFSLTWLARSAPNVARRYGTSVLTPTFRYHPSIVAQRSARMGAIVPGRACSRRHRRRLNEVPSTGQPWPNQGTLRSPA